jgi:hypothetical protein
MDMSLTNVDLKALQMANKDKMGYEDGVYSQRKLFGP